MKPSSKLTRIAAQLVRCGFLPSSNPDDWSYERKNLSKKAFSTLIRQNEKAEETCKLLARELAMIAKILRKEEEVAKNDQ